MFDFFQIISAKITAFITVVIVTVTSILPGVTSDANKLTDTAIASPSATISESPLPSTSPTTKSPLEEEQVPKKSPSSSTTPSLSPQKTDSAIHDKIWELQNELQKKNQLKQQPTTETKNPVSTPTPIPTTTVLNSPSTNNPAPANGIVYSDYIFGYTYMYSPDVPYDPGSPYKYLKFTETSRDLRITRAIFRISNEDAEKHDLIDRRYFPQALLFFCQSSCRTHYILERMDKNTFLYVGNRSGGLPITKGYIYLDISKPTLSEGGGISGGSVTNISLPMSEWEIWDNTTGKLVKTQ